MNTSQGSLAQRIRNAGKLASGEQAVVAYLQRYPGEAAVSSAAKLGEVTGTSDATVIRTARKLGFDGLADLKRTLVDHIARRRNPARVLDDRVRRLPEEGALRPVIDAGLAVLNEVPALLDGTDWERAISVLGRAEHVWAYGIGPSAAAADYMALSLRRAGKAADSWTATGFRLADDLLRVRQGHVVLVVAPLRVFREVALVLEHAHRVGAQTILLTEALAEVDETTVDVVLPMPDSTEDAANELLAPLTVLHALVLQLAASGRDEVVGRYRALNALRAEIAGPGLDVRKFRD